MQINLGKKSLYSCKWNGPNFRPMLAVGKSLARKSNVIHSFTSQYSMIIFIKFVFLFNAFIIKKCLNELCLLLFDIGAS